MSNTIDNLYELLPAIYRIRDSKQGEPLKALFGVICREAGIVEKDIDRLYENWFIETCEEWVVPYIGQLLGVKGLHTIESIPGFSMRAYVANTLRYRRRKGTAPVLEQLALDTTGWQTRAVEFFQLLGTTQNLNHIRKQNIVPANIKDPNILELTDTAFDSLSHTVDVRKTDQNNGWHNISNIGLFVARLESYPVTKSTAKKITAGPDEGFTFSPLGLDQNLFNIPRTEKEITHLAEEHNLPVPLRRISLYRELEKSRGMIAKGHSEEEIKQGAVYFGDQPVFQVYSDGNAVPAAEVLICNLKEWKIPGDKKTYPDEEGNDSDLPISVAVDPVLGRITFPSGSTPEKVQVSFNYGFSADTGAGTYNRREAVDEWYNPEDRPVTWQIGVTKNPDTIAEAHQPELLVETLEEAVDAWNTHIQAEPGIFGVISIMDSDTYEENLTGLQKIELPEGSRLAITAAQWPQLEDAENPGVKKRTPGNFIPAGVIPHILGNVSVKGTAGFNNPNPGELILDGLLIEGKVSILSGNLGRLLVSNSTIVPSGGGLQVNGKNSQLDLTLDYSISGPLSLSSWVPGVCVRNSIIDARGMDAIMAMNTKTIIEASTVMGNVEIRSIEAENSIFKGPCIAERVQEGCFRFSSITAGSRTPRRYKCQPDLALEKRAAEAGLERAASLPDEEKERVTLATEPLFFSVTFGHHDYAQLSLQCPREISEGADDSSEMGVFYYLKQPQRISNLQNALKEYLNLGLKAGLIFIT